jgi:hypothetical protein
MNERIQEQDTPWKEIIETLFPSIHGLLLPQRPCRHRLVSGPCPSGQGACGPRGPVSSFTASMRRTHAGSVRSQETPGSASGAWESLTTRLAADDGWTLLELGLNRQAIFDGYYDQRKRRSGIVRH